jgi:hypothetical protein
MGNCKNLREDNDLFPYEYGVSEYHHMREPIYDLYEKKDLQSNINLLKKYMLDNYLINLNAGESVKRKFLKLLSDYMNYRIRYPRHAEVLINDDKLRQLLEPLAKIICTEKSIFEEWVKKNPKGYGEYNYPNGKTYVGEWKDGKYHGQGILSKNGIFIYEGEWKNGKRHGQGTDMSKDDKHGYKGEWKDDKYHGLGINIVQNKHFINENGEWEEVKLEGEWQNSELHGQGSQKGKDWEAVGEFKDGERWNVTSFYNDRNIGTQVVNGVQQKITK